MDVNDLGRAVGAGVRLGRTAVGAGVSIALTPLRLVKHAVRSAPEDDATWAPVAPVEPAPAAEAVERVEPVEPVEPVDRGEPVPAPEAGPAPAPPPPPAPAEDVPRTNDLTAAEAARLREEEREATTDDDSPGPEIHVDEPWPGYRAMNVDQVLERLTGADQTTRAMVRLYEETHRNRKGILRATE